MCLFDPTSINYVQSLVSLTTNFTLNLKCKIRKRDCRSQATATSVSKPTYQSETTQAQSTNVKSKLYWFFCKQQSFARRDTYKLCCKTLKLDKIEAVFIRIFFKTLAFHYHSYEYHQSPSSN